MSLDFAAGGFFKLGFSDLKTSHLLILGQSAVDFCKTVVQIRLKILNSESLDGGHSGKHLNNKLFVGSDYKGTERFARYEAFMADKDAEIVYFPYTKNVSSTQISKALTYLRKEDNYEK